MMGVGVETNVEKHKFKDDGVRGNGNRCPYVHFEYHLLVAGDTRTRNFAPTTAVAQSTLHAEPQSWIPSVRIERETT